MLLLIACPTAETIHNIELTKLDDLELQQSDKAEISSALKGSRNTMSIHLTNSSL